jgi:flagellar motor switch protein FliN
MERIAARGLWQPFNPGKGRRPVNYLDCWISSAAALLPQALAGEAELVESLPRPTESSFAFTATLSGEQAGRFTVVVEESVLDTPLLGEGVDQKAAWGELLREIAEAAVGELLARTGQKCRVEAFAASQGESQVSRAFWLKNGERAWTLLVRDEVHSACEGMPAAGEDGPSEATVVHDPVEAPVEGAGVVGAGVDLLLDVELEATIRFGCREMPLGEILELGAGDVVQLDRHISDPADLVVGDKIVARGEVVLVNGNFGLRVTEVAAPRKRLESIRCLF